MTDVWQRNECAWPFVTRLTDDHAPLCGTPWACLQNFLEKVGGKVIEGLARFIMQQLVIAVRPSLLFPFYGNGVCMTTPYLTSRTSLD